MKLLARELSNIFGSIVFLCAVGAFSGSARGAEAGRRVVTMLVSLDQEESLRPVVRAVQSQLSDLNVSLYVEQVEVMPGDLRSQVEVAESVTRSSEAIAVFWCDLLAQGQIFLYLSQYEGKRILVRKLEETDADGRAEALAIIVRSSVGMMMQGGSIGVEVKETLGKAEPEVSKPAVVVPAQAPAAPETESVHLYRLSHSVAYAMNIHASDHRAVRGVDLGIAIHLNSNWSITAGYTILTPMADGSDILKLKLQRHPVRLGGRFDWSFKDVGIGAGVSLVLDYTTFEISNLESDMIAVSDKGDMVVGLLPAVHFAFFIVDRLTVFLSAGAEISFSAVHYQTMDRSGKKVLVDSWPVQPWFLGGFEVDIF